MNTKSNVVNWDNLNAVMHKYGIAPVDKNQIFLDQATAKSGHNISSNKIRTQQIPFFATKRDIQLGISNYEYITYFDKQKMTLIENSNYTAWQIIKNDQVQDDFISPADSIKNNNFSYGYAVEVFYKENESFIQLSSLKYKFDYYSGLLVFNDNVEYNQRLLYNDLYISVYQYNGLSIFDELNLIKNTLQIFQNYHIAIRKYYFDTLLTSDKIIWSDKYKANNLTDELVNIINDNTNQILYFRTLSIIIDDYCFNVESVSISDKKTSNGIIAADIIPFIENNQWKTKIEIQILCDESGKNIVKENNTYRYGQSAFLATVYCQSNGKSLKLLEQINLGE